MSNLTGSDVRNLTGSDVREVDTVTDIEGIAELRVKQLVEQIKTNKQLRALLRTVKPHLRKQVFEQWKPFLKFEPWNYLKLVR